MFNSFYLELIAKTGKFQISYFEKVGQGFGRKLVGEPNLSANMCAKIDVSISLLGSLICSR